MLDSLYHMNIKYFCNPDFVLKYLDLTIKYATLLWVSYQNVTCT